jgi:hypothetical protein
MARRDRNRSERFSDDEWDRGADRRSPRRQERDRRKEHRRRDRHSARAAALPVDEFAPALPIAVPVARVCGNCREWYPHDTGGRGDCGHPGSGFSFPWADTPACDFFAARR